MTPERWLRVKQVFHAAVEHNPDGRAAFLEHACGRDAALRAEVERLLSAHDAAGTFIERSPVAVAETAMRNTRAPLTGRVIGRYEIGRLIGSGGMGEVYAARDVELGRAVAIKVGIGGDADARLKREAQHASRLNHPNICTIHEIGKHDDQTFIVMELVEGETLSAIIPSSGLPVEHVVRYGMQIADALAHAHRGGVTHRDLKSANVLITPEGRPKVLDFGLARALSRETLSDLSHSRASITAEDAVAGTLSVMSPEMLRGEKADERSDIWSLGVLLYEMATGDRPFCGATGFELSGAILHEPPVPLPDRVPEDLARIIYRCLEKNPQDRYQDAGEVRAALEPVRDRAAAPGVRVPGLAYAGVAARWFLSRRWRHRLAWMLAIVAAYASYRLLLRSDDVPLAVGASGRPAIAVMHFQNAGAPDSNSAWLSSGVPNMLVTGLAQTRGLEIVSERRLLEALGPTGETNLAALDRTKAADVARRAGAGAIVVGSIFRAGSEIRIDAQVEDLASGRVLAAETVRGSDVFALVDQLASEIRDAVGFADAQGVRSVTRVSSTSLEAYRLYSQGTEAAANARWNDADKLLRSAVAIDPSFAEAYLRLSNVNAALGRRTARDEFFRLAVAHIDRLSERHRLLLDIQIAHDSRDIVRARRVLDDALAKFPDLEEAYPHALHLYKMDPEPDRERLLEITAAGAAALPASSHTRNAYGYALLGAGRYAEAIREFEAYARIAPREPNPHDSQGEAYLKMGDAEKAVAAYSRALTVDPTFAPSQNMRAWSLAVLGRYEAALAEPVGQAQFRAIILARVGRYREAAKVLTDGEIEAAASGNSARTGGLRLVAAVLNVERRDQAAALRDITAVDKLLEGQAGELQRLGRVLGHLLSGLAHIQAGRLTQAVKQFEEQGRGYNGANDVERSWRRSLEGEIALARGELAQAASAFSDSEPSARTLDPTIIMTSVLLNDLPSRDGLARVAIARGDLDGAIRIYRDLLVYGPDDKFIAPFEPRYVLQIARLLEKKRDSTAALHEYQRFLSFWKGADAGLPELAEARRAVARLTLP